MAGRLIYKLGTHSLKVQVVNSADGTKTSEYVKLPILSRCLRRIGELLNLDRATEEDIKVTKQIEGGSGGAGGGGQPGSPGGGEGEEESEAREVVYYRIGSWRADRIILVYEERQEGEGGGPSGGQGGGQGGEGEQGQQQSKRKTLRVPIPSWAPNYKVVPVLFSKAEAAGLNVIGAYRHGYLIPAPSQLGEGGGEEEG